MSKHDYSGLSREQIQRELEAASKRAAKEQAEIDAATEKARAAIEDADPKK